MNSLMDLLTNSFRQYPRAAWAAFGAALAVAFFLAMSVAFGADEREPICRPVDANAFIQSFEGQMEMARLTASQLMKFSDEVVPGNDIIAIWYRPEGDEILMVSLFRYEAQEYVCIGITAADAKAWLRELAGRGALNN